MLPLLDQAILVNDFRSQKAKKDEANSLHARLAGAIVEAMAPIVEGSTTQAGPVDQNLKGFANMVADVAFGQSIFFRLNRDLPEVGQETLQIFADALVRVSATVEANRLEAAIGKLADVLLPDELEAARGVLAADNLELRDRFVQEVPQFKSVDISKQSGSNAKNGYATATRWKKNGEILSVSHRGTEYYPAFQFRDGRPHPTIKAVLATLPETMTAWQRALWFVSSNGWLEDRAPMELLDDAKAVIDAAQREHDEVVG